MYVKSALALAAGALAQRIAETAHGAASSAKKSRQGRVGDVPAAIWGKEAYKGNIREIH